MVAVSSLLGRPSSDAHLCEIALGREGWAVNHKWVHRLWQETATLHSQSSSGLSPPTAW